MGVFLVDGQNKVGELASVTEAIAAAGVNITAVCAAACTGGGAVALTTSDDAATRRALDGGRWSYREAEAAEAALEDRPGTLAACCRKLADNGINIEALLATGMSGGRITVAFVTGDPASAKRLLGEAAAGA